MILYHQTAEENVDSILEQGLLRSKSQMWQGRGGVVYLGTTPNMSFGDVTLKVSIPEEWLEGEWVLRISDWEYMWQRDIPPENIMEMV